MRLMLRKRATETKFLARTGGARCPAYGFFWYFALSFYMNQPMKAILALAVGTAEQQSARCIIKQRATGAGVEGFISGHSLRLTDCRALLTLW